MLLLYSFLALHTQKEDRKSWMIVVKHLKSWFLDLFKNLKLKMSKYAFLIVDKLRQHTWLGLNVSRSWSCPTWCQSATTQSSTILQFNKTFNYSFNTSFILLKTIESRVRWGSLYFILYCCASAWGPAGHWHMMTDWGSLFTAASCPRARQQLSAAARLLPVNREINKAHTE